MPQTKQAHRMSLSTYKSRKRYRKDLEQAGVKVPGATKQSSKKLVSKVPLSLSLKHNDHYLFRLMHASREDEDDDDWGNDVERSSEEPAKFQTGNLREFVQNIEREAKRMSRLFEEQRERGCNWGSKTSEEFDFLQSQARDLMGYKGVTPYTPGTGKIQPTEIIGEVERSEEAMDDAVVEYSRSAGLLSRFRVSTSDKPVPSGAFMRPTVPSTNQLERRVRLELEGVRNRMFRLDSMFKEQGHSHQLQVGRMSAIMTWKRDKHEAQENLLQPIECLQTADELMEARLRSVSPSNRRGGMMRYDSTLRRGSFRSPDAVSPSSLSAGAKSISLAGEINGGRRPSVSAVSFEDVRPKTAGAARHSGMAGSRIRPQTAGSGKLALEGNMDFPASPSCDGAKPLG